MRFLLDTQLLLWATGAQERLSEAAEKIIPYSTVRLFYSSVSVWEVAIKSTLGRSDFYVKPARFLEELIDRGYAELPVHADHAIAVAELPTIHRDPFDRMLIGQATSESIMLLTADRVIGSYPGPIQMV
ncbi:MAG: type II toxin-antitoxin system VapC family toxin [Gammaproteobacteria bacterium]|nr:type II toxin-antitoxin system VapC family toxin [Gammaproteobacteria bacterium]